MLHVQSADFARHFATYQRQVQEQPVAITEDGETSGYFISVADFEELAHYRALSGQSFATSDLPADLIAAISTSTMAPEHNSLNALLDDA